MVTTPRAALFNRRLSQRVFAAVAFLIVAGLSRAAAPRVTFSNSLAPMPVAVGRRTTASVKVVFSVAALSTEQLSAPLEFSVALGMRNLAEFQTRIASGELVPYEEVQAKYLPLPADYARVLAWLASEGFKPTFKDSSRLSIFVVGTVAQIQRSFALTMQSVTVDGIAYTAATTAPSLPAAVSAGVIGVNGLQPYIQKHTYHRTPSTTATGGAAPNSLTTPNAPPFLVGEIRNAYNGATLTTTVNGTTTTLDGTGQKIAIVIDAVALSTDLTTFWKNNSVPQVIGDIETVTVGTGKADAREEEETLDEEWSSGLAPAAHVRVYDSLSLTDTNLNKCLAQIQTDVTGSTAAAIAQPQLHAMSMSYGEDQNGVSNTEYNTEAGYYATIANGNTFYGGVSIFASSGDAGSQPDETSSASYIVSYPAADLSITAVGGSDLYYSTTIVNGRNWTEKGWGEYSNFTIANEGSYSGFGGSGGGAATSTIARPAWQVGTGVPSGTTRLVPDVASVGGPTVADLEYSSTDTFVFGTSWSSPSWAAYSALINQARALNGRLPLGLLGRHVYPLIGTSSFYDITTGNNSYTSSKTNGTSGTANYSCTTGYDEVTGVGTPNLSALVSSLTGPTITGFTPANGPAGTSVVITGTNFYPSAYLPLTATFNGVAASAIMVNSATQITTVAPAGVTTGPIVVTSIGDATTSGTNFTTPAPDLTTASTHIGNFTQADTGDTYTLTVANAGTAATNGTVTLTDTLPGGLSATAMSGSGWTCSVNTLTATRSDALAAGRSYPAITLTVNVAYNAPASVTNSVSVSGGGELNTANDSGTDPTTIIALTPSQSWRYEYFGTTSNTGEAADTANPSGDGIVNLIKYALGLNPLVATVTTVTGDITTGYLRLTVPKNPNATDITYTVQVTTDLTNPASWTTDGTTIDVNTSSLLQVHDTTAVAGNAPQLFIRLQVSR
jgi:kumamolisin